MGQAAPHGALEVWRLDHEQGVDRGAGTPDAAGRDPDLRPFERRLARRGYEASAANGPLKELLPDLRLAQRRQGKIVPTVAGVLLLGKDPQALLPHRSASLAQFGGNNATSSIINEVRLTGARPILIDKALAFITEHRRTMQIGDGEHGERLPEYPLEAVREAVVSAVAHRGCRLGGANTRILMFESHREVISPGPLPAPHGPRILGLCE
jgi:predicted HTH transcriptional regulator